METVAKERTLFDVWADLSYLHYQLIHRKIEDDEFTRQFEELLRELKARTGEGGVDGTTDRAG